MASHLLSARSVSSRPKKSSNGVAFERANWWLRDVSSGTNFANVNNNGNANNNGASNSNGVRPDFGKCRQDLSIGKHFNRKERLSLPKG